MRQARQIDAPALAELIRATGLDDNPDPARIARVVVESNHVTLVETAADGRLIGFVDGFMTISADGTLRWEIDLLGVHPEQRGRGVAQGLARASAEVGRDMGAAGARALVRTDNFASLKTFERCGFALADETFELYVSGADCDEWLPAPDGAHLISVSTLTYSGVWVEGKPSSSALRCAQAARTRLGWDVAGAVLPAGTFDLQAVGYERVGEYRWLRLDL